MALHYIGPAKNDLKFQYKEIVRNKDDTESLMATVQVRSFYEIEDYVFTSKNCLKLHHDLTERFRTEKGELAVLLKIVRFGE